MTERSVEPRKIEHIYDYLSAPHGETEGDGAFVFGRKDARLIKRLAPLMNGDEAELPYALLTGGIGKDSGELARHNIPEAVYLAIVAEQAGIPLERLILEQQATNGGENARFGLEVLTEEKVAHDALVVVAHATSLRRLTETLRHETDKAGLSTTLGSTPTNYPFDSTKPSDQLEAVQEMLRLYNWPEKGWLGKQDDLPVDLAEYAKDVEPHLKETLK